MARPAPNQQKNNFLQTLLIMALIFTGFQIFMRPQDKAPTFENKTISSRTDYLWALREANAKGLELTAQQLQSTYNGLVDEDQKKKVLTQDQAIAAKVEGVVLVADSYYRGGLIKDDSGKMRSAYQMLDSYHRHLSNDAAWQTPITVATTDLKGQTQVTGEQMLTQVVETLKKRNQTDLIYGFIPGGWQFINALVNMTGAVPGFSYAFAAFLLALVVRAIVFPLSQKQLMVSREMSQLTPRIREIKDMYKDDQAQQNAKVMELYKEYGLNPLAGCLPALIQMPLFLTVYQCMLHYQFQFQNGYFLWINPATSKATHGLIAANLGQQDYILVIIYGITMLISQFLTPVTDPTQKTQQRIMGLSMVVIFTVFMFLGIFPIVSGFVLYWTFTNILSTAQALRAYRMPLPPLVKVNTMAGGVYPSGKGPKGKWAQMIDDMQSKMVEEQKRSQELRARETQVIEPPTKNGSSNGKASNGKPSKNGSAPKPSGGTGQPAKHKPKKRA
jgi:YidC/Oxa1 family membrane protein insertase